jgi:putative peptide zinc metalloprotease protein
VVSFSHSYGVASGEVTIPDWRIFKARERVPRLIPGVEAFGEYQGSGLTNATYLVRNPGGQIVQVSQLLHLVLAGIDGHRTVSDIAERVTAAFGKTVSPGNVEYLLDNKLAPLGLLAGADGTPDAAAGAQDQAILGLKLRRTLVPAGGVQRLSWLFRPLFSPGIVIAAMGGLAGSDIWLLREDRLGPAFRYVLLHPLLLLLVLGLAVLSMLFHECGHAAACRYGGARPGVIGMGIYVIWPAFFTNVTDAYRLGRAGRIRTDLGGVYFNAIFALGLTLTYLATGCTPLIAAVVLVHMEIIQQLLPSLRFDGYFILADMIGVPDLFRRIVPTLRSMIPGQPADPRVQGLKRAARVTLTAWVLVMVPLIAAELAVIILDAPSMARTFARSLLAQVAAVTAQFGQGEIPAGLVSVLSVVLLVLPTAGLSYILLVTGYRAGRGVVAVNRRRPVLRLPSVAMGVILAAALMAHWGVLPRIGGHGIPFQSAASNATVPQASQVHPQPQPLAPPAPAQAQAPARAQPPARAHAPAQAPALPRSSSPVRPAVRPARQVTVLTPVSASGFDPLSGPGSDPSDENSALARYAIDDDPGTAWQTQYYLGSPFFGGLKTGSGLILDMGRQVRLRSVTITFGPVPGADVAIEVGNDDIPAAATLPTFTTVATADGIGGKHVFRTARSSRGRYVLIWFTKLPPAGLGRFQAQILNISIRGMARGGARTVPVIP